MAGLIGTLGAAGGAGAAGSALGASAAGTAGALGAGAAGTTLGQAVASQLGASAASPVIAAGASPIAGVPASAAAGGTASRFIPFAEAVRDIQRPALAAELARPAGTTLRSPFAEAVGFLDLPRGSPVAPETAPSPPSRRTSRTTPVEIPNAPSGPTGPAPLSAARRPPTADPERVRELIRTLQEEGVDRLPAIGIAGNIFQESSFNPHAVGDNGRSVGIAQFNGPRAEALFRFARQRGEKVADITGVTDFRTIPREQFPSFATQARFIAEELRTTEAKAAERLRSATSPEQAASIASAAFFRPGDPRLENRINAARRFASEFPEDQPSPVEAALARARRGDFSALDTLPVELRLSVLRKLGASLGAPNPR